ncbi:MAG: bactofilin family protein [Solirubrobacteraceae bacterium]
MDKRAMGWRRLVPGVPGAPEESATPPRPETETGPSEQPHAALIERGVEMNGRLVVSQALRIEGEFRGELESASSVFVSETGTVEAPIKARTLEIRGAVVGDVVASREIVIHPTGRLHGDVETPSLVVMRGATFNGRTRMYRPERNAHATALPDRHADAPAPESHA